MRVLLVDDEHELVSALAERLSFRGIDADWVSTCNDAIKRLDCKSFDVAILDVKMPKMSGIDLKRALQKKCPTMKFIFMTGHGSQEDFKDCCEETGAGYYLIKPVDIEALINKIKEVLII